MSNLRPRAPTKPRRRGRGEGGVSQLANGDWQGTISLGINPATGKPARRKIVRKTRPLLLEAIAEAKEKGLTFVPSETITVAAWLRRWLSEKEIRPKTVDAYRSVIEGHLIPALGAVKLAQLTSAHVQTFFANAVKTGAPSRQMQIALIALNQALRNARKLGLVDRNVAEDQEAPKHRKRRKTGDEAFCYDLTQARELLAIARHKKPLHHPLLNLAFDTGARQGEIFGAQWEDFDLRDVTQATWSIQHNLIEVAKPADALAAVAAAVVEGDVVLVAPTLILTSTPKTDDGFRTIQLSRSCAEALVAHRLLAGGAIAKGFVFKGARGGILRNANFWSDTLEPLERAAGLPRVTFHGLRHTTATILLEAGVPVHVVSHRLGHRDSAITLKTYAHVLAAMARKAAAVAGDLFGGGHLSGHYAANGGERSRTDAAAANALQVVTSHPNEVES